MDFYYASACEACGTHVNHTVAGVTECCGADLVEVKVAA